MVGALLLKGFDCRIDYLSFGLIMGSAILVGRVFEIVRFLALREHTLTIIDYSMVDSILGSLFFYF